MTETEINVKLLAMQDGFINLIVGQDKYVLTLIAIDEANVAILNLCVDDIDNIIKELTKAKKQLKR